jgi:hypothetical protein
LKHVVMSLLATCCLLLSGCLTLGLSQYHVLYSCGANPIREKTKLSEFAKQLEDGLRVFGFRRVQIPNDPTFSYAVFDLNSKIGRVTIGVFNDEYVLSVKDYRAFGESSFMQRVNAAIAKPLDERCGGVVESRRIANMWN